MAATLLAVLCAFAEVALPASPYLLPGSALVVCARAGVPPEAIEAIFGQPEASARGRLDWRTNPARYILLDYWRYGVWVEWEDSPFPHTGRGPAIRVQGGID